MAMAMAMANIEWDKSESTLTWQFAHDFPMAPSDPFQTVQKLGCHGPVG
jgi:hypothetical protein